MNFKASNLTWEIFIFGQKINPTYLGLPNNTFVLTPKSVAFIYNTVKSLRLCKGIQNLATPEKDSQGVLKEILQEGNTKDHTTKITIFKSMKCVKVLNFKCLSDNLCTECRSIKRNSLKRQTVIEMNSDHLVNEMPCAIEPCTSNDAV